LTKKLMEEVALVDVQRALEQTLLVLVLTKPGAESGAIAGKLIREVSAGWNLPTGLASDTDARDEAVASLTSTWLTKARPAEGFTPLTRGHDLDQRFEAVWRYLRAAVYREFRRASKRAVKLALPEQTYRRHVKRGWLDKTKSLADPVVDRARRQGELAMTHRDEDMFTINDVALLIGKRLGMKLPKRRDAKYAEARRKIVDRLRTAVKRAVVAAVREGMQLPHRQSKRDTIQLTGSQVEQVFVYLPSTLRARFDGVASAVPRRRSRA
jgi:hypothetical protein